MVYIREHRASFAQNYIKNPSLARYLIGLAHLDGQDSVLELGAGGGILTEEIVKAGGSVVALEIDLHNAQALRTKFQGVSSVHIVERDALTFEPKWAPIPLNQGAYVVVGNIPFNISSSLIKRFALKKPFPGELFLIVQREFAERVLGTKERSLVSTLLETFYEGAIIHDFQREDFSPMPGVEVIYMHLALRRDIPQVIFDRLGEFKDMVKRGYTQPIKNILGKPATRLSGKEWINVFIDNHSIT